MKILITGGAGFIGSHTAEFYAKQGWDVIVLDNLKRSAIFKQARMSVEHNWEYLAQFEQITRIVGDVRNEADVMGALADGVDVILHAAAQPGVYTSIENPKEDFMINSLGTFTVLECARAVCPGATILYCSTNKVYGENVDDIPLNESESRYSYEGLLGVSEDMPLDLTGHTPYGVSKYHGDLYVQEYAHCYGMKTGVFRMSCIYGTRQYGFEDQGWIAHFIISALHSRPITIFGNGKQVRDVLYISDLIAAYNAFIESPITHGVFNMGGGPEQTTSILELLDYLEQTESLPTERSFDDWRKCDQRVYISDITKAQRALNWQPTIAPHEGVSRLVAWARDNKELFI